MVENRADLHMHTRQSDGVMKYWQLVEAARKRGLRAVAATNHDKIGDSYAAWNYSVQKEYDREGLEVVVGQECTTTGGDVLALFIHNEIPKGLSLAKTIYEIHKQDGLAVLAHPFASRKIVNAARLEDVFEIMLCEDDGVYLDAFEDMNNGMRQAGRIPLVGRIFERGNVLAKRFYDIYKREYAHKLGAEFAGTDGHKWDVGLTGIAFYGDSAREAIERRETVVFSVDNNEHPILDFGYQAYSGLVRMPVEYALEDAKQNIKRRVQRAAWKMAA